MSGGQMMVVLIVGIVMIASIIKGRYRGSRHTSDDFSSTAASASENRHLKEEVRALRERIQVLERVITDQHSTSDLDREIEKLRDHDRS